MSQIRKLITQKYMVALLVIGLLDTFSFATLLIVINLNKDNAYLINISGRQRMLSQRITLELNQFHYAPESEHKKISIEAKHDIDEFEQANLILTHRSKKIDRSIPKKIIQYYFKENGTNDQSQYFIARARQIIEEKVSPEELSEFSTFAKHNLLRNLNEAVLLFEEESNSLNTTLIKIEVLIYLLAFLNLGLILKLLFIPLRDILVRREKELFLLVKKLKEEGKYKSRFLANMGHELRTPLNGILGVVDLIQDEPVTVEQGKLLNIVEKSGKNLLGTIDNILDLTRLEIDELGMNLKDFSPDVLIAEIGQEYAIQAKAKGLSFESQVHNLPGILHGDHTKIRKIISNILDNAIKFTDSGSIKIDTTYDEFSSLFNVKIHDTGTGIAPDNLELIFEPFKQVDSSSTRIHSGSGLGLTIAKKMAEIMRGTLKVSSQLEVGSSFTLSLPLRKTSIYRDPIQQKEQEVEEMDEFYKGNILLIEPSEDNRKLITKMITRYGPTIESALSFKVANRLIATRNYQLTFINTSSHMDGLIDSIEQFINRIPPSTRVYLMGSNQTLDLSQSLLERISEVIELPITNSKIQEILKIHLDIDEDR